MLEFAVLVGVSVADDEAIEFIKNEVEKSTKTCSSVIILKETAIISNFYYILLNFSRKFRQILRNLHLNRFWGLNLSSNLFKSVGKSMETWLF